MCTKQSQELPKDITDYINERYDRWLDYSTYHCNRTGIPGHEIELLNEVLLSLLEKPTIQIIKLYNQFKKEYRDLDYFVLAAIKMNAISDTAPYRYKYLIKRLPECENVQSTDLTDIIDSSDDDTIDRPAEILAKYKIINEVLYSGIFTDLEINVFEYRNIKDLTIKETREIYGAKCRLSLKVEDKIKDVITKKGYLDSKGYLKDEVLEKYMSD